MSENDHVTSSSGTTPPRSLRPKRPATITPRRFNRFFDPSSSRERRSSSAHSVRALQELGPTTFNQLRVPRGDADSEDFSISRPAKRRKESVISDKEDTTSIDVPIASSPLYHVASSPPIAFDQSSPCVRRRSLSARPVCIQAAFNPIKRLRYNCGSIPDHRNLTADFYSSPKDVHQYSHPVAPFCVATCNTNTLIAVGDEQGGIRLIESAKTQKPDFDATYLSFQPHGNAIMHMAFSSDDRWLATGCGDQTSKVIDMLTQTPIHVLSADTSTVRHVAFQPGNDNVLAICTRDGSVNLYDIRSPKHAARIQSIPKAHLPDNHSAAVVQSGNVCPSVTAVQFLSRSRAHLFLTSSDATTSLRLWDIRGRYSVRQRAPIPLSTTLALPGRTSERGYGITSLARSTDHSRFYAICKDSTIYAYSTNHVALGQAPEFDASTPAFKRQKGGKGLGPLYGFRNSSFKTNTFYVRAAVRQTNGMSTEMLAVGSSEGCPVLFPTDERLFTRPTTRAGIDIYDVGTPLIGGHSICHDRPKEVTGVAWTTEGDLISVGDDYTVRCWREDSQVARDLRLKADGEAARFDYGWADVDDERWDDDDG